MLTVTVKGKEYPLELTVQAFSDISELCPGKDFSRIGELKGLSAGEMMVFSARILAALSKGAEEKLAFENPKHTKDPLDARMLMNMPVQEFTSICKDGVFNVLSHEMNKSTVGVEPSKKKEKSDL